MTDETYFERGREYYKATDNRVWPRRNREFPSAKPGCKQHKKPLIANDLVRILLERLDSLEKETRPSGGDTTAAEKDEAAFQALRVAGQLVEYVAGWAIDHQIGLAAKGMGFVPPGTYQVKEHPEYQAARKAANSHEHERAGGRTKALDPLGARTALVNLLLANPGGFPDVVRHGAVEALEALSFEEVLPMLAPAKGNRKVKHVELQLQLHAVGFVEFQIATGIKKLEALKTAARVLCVAESTISGWEYRLRAELGQLTVMRTLTKYSNWGRAYKANKERWAAGDKDADPDTFEFLGGLLALQKVAERYRALEK